MNNPDVKNISRKRFLFWSGALISAIGITKILNLFGKTKTGAKKYLTQDGQLVEVDKKYTESRGVKIYTSELKDWIKK